MGLPVLALSVVSLVAVLPIAMPIEQPARQEECCGEGLGLYFLKIVASVCLERRASKDTFAVQAWCVAQMVVP